MSETLNKYTEQLINTWKKFPRTSGQVAIEVSMGGVEMPDGGLKRGNLMISPNERPEAKVKAFETTTIEMGALADKLGVEDPSLSTVLRENDWSALRNEVNAAFQKSVDEIRNRDIKTLRKS